MTLMRGINGQRLRRGIQTASIVFGVALMVPTWAWAVPDSAGAPPVAESNHDGGLTVDPGLTVTPTTASTTTTTTTTAPASSTTIDVGGAGDERAAGALPRTGVSPVRVESAIGALLVAAGVAMSGASRRRRMLATGGRHLDPERS